MKKNILVVIGVVALALALDQCLKVWVKTHMYYGQDIPILGLSWAKLSFVENFGMAFGWALGVAWGKLALSLFRMVAIGFLISYIRKLIIRGASPSFLVCLSLILAGAVGNMIDSSVYGLVFSASDPVQAALAVAFPHGGGYAGFLHGKVVDMLHFTARYPNWFPRLHGQEIFPYVFNISDSCITCGVTCILLFHQRMFSASPSKKEVDHESLPPEDTNIVSV